LRLLAIASALLSLSLITGPTARGGMSVAERQLAKGINEVRVEHGLRPLTVSVALTNAAREHDREMSSRGFFSHNSLDRSEFWRRVLRWYPPTGRRGWLVGENILWESSDISAWASVMRWLRSPPHRAVLLNPAWREVGVDVRRVPSAPGVYGGGAATIITADFGVR
jgi:uncharacterized protein YkwD